MDELMHRQQFHRRHAQPPQVVDGGRRAQAGIGAALLLRDLGMPLGKALDVHFVDDRLVPRRPRRAVVAPVEIRIGHHAAGHEGRAVRSADDQVALAQLVRVHRLVPAGLAFDRLGVGVEQQLRGIAALPLLGSPGSVHAVGIALAWPDAGQVAVPDVASVLGKLDPLLVAALVEEAKVDAGGDLGEEREVGAGAVIGGAEWIGAAGPDLHRARV